MIFTAVCGLAECGEEFTYERGPGKPGRPPSYCCQEHRRRARYVNARTNKVEMARLAKLHETGLYVCGCGMDYAELPFNGSNHKCSNPLPLYS